MLAQNIIRVKDLTGQKQSIRLRSTTTMLTILTLFCLFLSSYVYLRAVHPLPCSKGIKVLLGILLVIIAFKFHLLYLWEGKSLFSPDLPSWVVLPGVWLHTGLIFYCFCLLLLDIIYILIRLPAWACRRKMPFPSGRIRNLVNLALLVFLLGSVGYGVYRAVQLPEVRYMDISLPKLPARNKPLRLAVLSDLHADSTKSAAFFREIVQRTNALKPDLILICGDFVDGGVERLAPVLAPLAHLQSGYGTYAVAGNHDYFSGYGDWKAYLQGIGIRFLDNEHILTCGGQLVLAGVTDPAARRAGYTLPSAVRALENAPEHLPRILLAHQPKLFPYAVLCGVDLQISGHTHGGMAPGLRQLVALFNGGYVSGLYQHGDARLYVSNGTSLWTGMAIRLNTPAEITLITLRGES